MDVTTLHWLALAGLSYVLGTAASYVAKRAELISKSFGISDFVIGFFIVGVATSMPEITVTINSALQNIPELSLGNLLGASVVVFSLLTGLAAIFSGKLQISRFLKDDDFILYLIVSSLPALAVIDGNLSRLDGWWLIGAYLVVGWKLYSRHRIYKEDIQLEKHQGPHHLVGQVVGLLIGIVVLIVASNYLVNSAVTIANIINVPAMVIGLLALSIGTNLPELALVLTAKKNNSKNLVLGDLMSNVLLNVPTLGLLAILQPFTISQLTAMTASAIFLVVATAAFGVLMWSRRALTASEGITLVVIYAAYALMHVLQSA